MTDRPRNVEEQSLEQPSIAPFIDITFQLLVFFMLTIKFKQEEGHLLSMLPKEKGPFAAPKADVDVHEVRIYVCADDVGRRFDRHIGVKETHQQTMEDLKRANPGFGDVCHAWIELNYPSGTKPLYRTERFPGKIRDNKRVYDALAQEVKALQAQTQRAQPQSGVPVMIDVDGLVPWEHAFGLLNALQKAKVTNIEWAANPRFQRYIGPN